jgi:hypothetical protein
MNFQVGQKATHVTDGEVTVIEVLPVSTRIFYRIEYPNGDRSLAIDTRLRPHVLSMDKD